jgi:hypothetical protein
MISSKSCPVLLVLGGRHKVETLEEEEEEVVKLGSCH